MEFVEEEFVAFVKEYIALIEGAADLWGGALLSRVSVLLPHIYALGMTIPDLEPETEFPISYVGPEVPATLLEKLEKYDSYYETLDPVTGKDVVVGSLSDDLADIYEGLKGPLDAYREDRQKDALWQWRFNLRGRCGDQLVNALRAVHRIVNDHLDPGHI